MLSQALAQVSRSIATGIAQAAGEKGAADSGAADSAAADLAAVDSAAAAEDLAVADLVGEAMACLVAACWVAALMAAVDKLVAVVKVVEVEGSGVVALGEVCDVLTRC